MSILESESDASKENQNPISQKGLKDLRFRDEVIVDKEIMQIQMEMSRLLLKLESLKFEKHRIKEGRKQSMNSKLGLLHKIQVSNHQQRRGVSLCPEEIYSASKFGQEASKDVTVSAKQSSRRQSCFWKPGEIDELKVTKERGSGNGGSVSPKLQHKAAPIVDDAMKKTKTVTNTTIGTKKALKKDDVVSSSVQPNRLFRDTERSLASKIPPVHPCRAVASRYNHNSQSSTVDCVGKLQSLPMSGKESSGRVKKRWEIPAKGEIVVYKSCDTESTPVVDEIRTFKCVAE